MWHLCLLLWAKIGIALLGAPVDTQAMASGNGRTQNADELPRHAIARLGSSAWRQPSQITGLAWSPDDKTIASGSGTHDGGAILMWERSTGHLIQALPPQFAAGGLIFSKDSKELMVPSIVRGNSIRVLEAGKIIREFSVPGKRPVQSISWSDDQKTLSVGGERAAWVYDFDNAKPRLQLSVPYEIVAVAISPNGRCLAASGRAPTDKTRGIFLWDAQTGKELGRLQGHDGGNCERLAFSDDATLVTIGGPKGDKLMRFWDLATKKQLGAVDGGVGLALSPDGKIAATWGVPETAVDFWDVATRTKRMHISDCGSRVTRLAFSPDGKRVVTGGWSASLRIWDTTTGKEITVQRGHLHGVHDLAFSPDGNLLASRSGDATARLWDWRAKKELHQFELAGPTKRFFDKGTDARLLVFSPDGKHLAAGGRTTDGARPYVVQLFDVLNHREVGRWDEERSWARGLDFSADGTQLASAFNFAVRVRDVPSGRELHRMAVPNTFRENYGSGDSSLSFVPNSDLLATGGEFEGIRLWHPDSQKHVGQIPTELAPVLQFCFMPNGLLLTCEGQEGRVNIYERGTNKKVANLFKGGPAKGSEFSNTSIAFSPGGQLIATGSKDNLVRVWSALTGQEIAKFDGHRGTVTGLAFSPDGKLLASGSADTTILLWDIANLQTLPSAGNVESEELAKLWHQMVDVDRATAYQGLGRLASAREKAVDFIRKNLPAIKDPDASEVKALLDELDHDKPAIRNQATAKLQKMGLLVEPALRERLSEKVSAEARQRVEGLLDKLKNTPTNLNDQRQLWAIFLLECINSPEARAGLTDLAAGARALPSTQAAKAALKRLAKR